jgi:S-formylglutathione hydrolase FrmB
MIRRPWILAVLASLLAGLCVAFTQAPATAGAPTFTSGNGLTVVSSTFDGSRTYHLVVSTAALSKPVRVNVLVPSDYAATTQRYPTLYLFHGTSGGADDWITSGNVVAATAGLPLIVVMPDAGYNSDGGGWFTNWVDQKTSLGVANWETFHINQLVPWIDANLRTIANRGGRAIAGLSQGGFGSFSYAARHPDLFSDAASFSGAPDIASNPVAQGGAELIIGATATALDGVEPNAMFGDPVLDRINWLGHNPATLVTNLASTELDLWTGNGTPGPFDSAGVNELSGEAIETIVHASAHFFASAANNAHVPYYLDDYGPGTHSWPYWARDLVQYLPKLMAHFASPAAAPTTISYKSVDKAWSQWGWTVSNNRVVSQAWSALSSASTAGFVLTDTNAAVVSTPASYAPGGHYVVTAAGGTTAHAVVASAAGTITLTVRPALLHTSVTVRIAAA